jgi:transaldolase
MKATRLLHHLGQGIWLDNIIDELSVTELTSNPTVFDHAIKNSSAYDSAIRDELAWASV